MSDSSSVQSKKQEEELYELAQHDLVASVLYNPDSLNKILQIISVEDFAHEKYSAVMQAIVHVSRDDTPINVVSVAKKLEETGFLGFVGGMVELYDLYSEGEEISVSNPPSVIANIVKESSIKAKVRDSLKESLSTFEYDSGMTASSAIEEVQSFLSEQALVLNDDSSVTTAEEYVKSFDEVLAERKKISEENKEISGGLQGIPTLLPSLNKYTSGFTPGQLITVGASTGGGKSVFAIMCTNAALKAKKSVMFFSLEMSEEEVFDRVYANMAEVRLNNIKSGDVSDEERARLKETSEFLSTAKLKIDANPKETVDSIRSKAVKQQQTEEGLDFIIIDYLQLISASARFNSRQEFIADLSRNIKLLAKTLQIPIMILVQLNRPKGESTENERPTLDRIRESGAIAQDSDIVILLHRENSVDNKIPQTLVLLEKNRSGESNKTIRCHTELAYSDFREVKSKDLTGGEGSDGDNIDDDSSFDETGTAAADEFYSDDFNVDFDFEDGEDFFDD